MQKGDNEKDSVEWKDIELNQSWYETTYVEMEDYYQYREDTTWLESVYGTECYICYEPMTKTQFNNAMARYRNFPDLSYSDQTDWKNEEKEDLLAVIFSLEQVAVSIWLGWRS